jgi:hypothetical protein
LILAIFSLPYLARAAANDSANVAVRYHCAGALLTANTNLSTLQKALVLPSAGPVQKLVLQRFSRLLADGLNLGTNASTVSLMEPLLGDVLKTESLGSFGGSATNSLHFVLALCLDTNRAQLWQDNLAKAFGGPGEKFTVEEFDGWRWNRGATDSFWIVPARGWLVAGRGDEFLPMQIEYLQQISKQGRPAPSLQDNWLEADIDWARLPALMPDFSRVFKPARIKISIASEADNLHIIARVIYPEAIPWKSSPWQTPTELVKGPLNSFTAGQDIAAYLNLGSIFSPFAGDPLTSQYYSWGINQMLFETHMAWLVADPANALQRLSTEAATFNPELKKFNGTELLCLPKQQRIVLSNLRVILPSLNVAQDKTSKFLLFSLLPHLAGDKPLPDELWNQIRGRTNLVYYDWEMTGPRLHDWLFLGPMLLTRWHDSTDDEDAAGLVEDRWLADLTPLPGNTVTEMTRVAPNELSVVRNAPFGFTGIEMFLLRNWLSTVGTQPIDARPSAH